MRLQLAHYYLQFFVCICYHESDVSLERLVFASFFITHVIQCFSKGIRILNCLVHIILKYKLTLLRLGFFDTV